MLKRKAVIWTVGGLMLLVLLLGQGFFSSPEAAANPAEQDKIIRVLGEAEIKANPDLARINFGVETTASTAKEAVEENSRLMEQVIKALKAEGVKETQIKTGSYNVYSYQQPVDITRLPEKERQQETMYRAANDLELTVENLDKVGSLIDSAVNAGVNRVRSVRFELSKAENLKIQALKNATAQALRKGEAIAQSAGIKIQGIKSISEEMASYTPFRAAFAEDMIMESAAPTPIIPGEVEVRARVIVEYYF